MPVSLKDSILKRQLASFPARDRKLVQFQAKLQENFPKTCAQDVDSLRKACFCDVSQVFRDSCVEIKERREVFLKKGKTYLKMLLFFQNLGDAAICRGNCEFYAENGSFFKFSQEILRVFLRKGVVLWVKPQKMPEKLQKKAFFVMEIVISFKEIPFSLLFADFSYEFLNKFDEFHARS